jgi:lipopolysaccharide transport system permease protein
MRLISSQPDSVPISEFFRAPLRHRHLLFRLIQRDVVGRYRGSLIGLAWSFFTPLIMLFLYTFVFSSVFNARWKGYSTSAGYALVVFSGLIVHGLLAECITRAPQVIVSNPNYVKKMVFPLEIYAWVVVGSAVFHAMVSWVVLLLAQLVLGVGIPPTALLFPLVLAPLALGCLGVVWLLSALGTYYRDIVQLTGVVASMLLFLAPVFYSIDALPAHYRHLLYINPLTAVLEQARQVELFGMLPTLNMVLACYAVGLLVALCGFVWFQKLRAGFADVV